MLGLHLTSRHLLVIHGASAAAAAAVWLDSNTLEPAQELALPAGVSYVLAEYGVQKLLISTCLGDVYTMSAQPKASDANTAQHELVSMTLTDRLCKFRRSSCKAVKYLSLTQFAAYGLEEGLTLH